MRGCAAPFASRLVIAGERITLTAREGRLIFWGAVVAPAALLGSLAFLLARRGTA